MLNFSDPMTGFVLPDTQVHVSLGWLMLPEDLYRQYRHAAQRLHPDTWVIYAHSPDGLAPLLHSELVPRGASLEIIASSAGAIYAVAVHQLAGLQLRSVLSLQDLDTQKWLRQCAVTGTATMALEAKQPYPLAVLRSDCSDITEDHVDSLIERCAMLGHQAYCADAAALVRHLADAAAMPSLVKGVEVQEVRLVLAFEGVSHDAAKTREERNAALH